MTFITVDKRGRATFPASVRRDLGLDSEDGSLVLLEKTDHGTYELVPAAMIPKDQLWFHDPEMRERVAQAESDFAEGDSTRTESPQEAQELLDSLKHRA